MAPPHVLVILAADAVPASLRPALERVGCSASFWPLAEALRCPPGLRADALVLVLPDDATEQASGLRVLFDRLSEQPRPMLVVSSGGCPPGILDHAATMPVTFDNGRDEQELAVRLATLLELRHSLVSLHRNLLANRRQGDSRSRRYVSQLRLASQVQRGFLPHTLPRFGPVSFDCLFRPVDYVSGDIYGVHRLDEEHVGIALADASGHGIPAALLTVYIKRALRGKEIGNGTYRILPPDEVLRGLNEDVLEAGLTECPFVAAVYAVLNIRTLELELARGGAPYPIHRTHRGELRLIDPPGSVVGVLAQARFVVRRLQLARGDSLLIHSDGLERIVAASCDAIHGPPPLRRVAERIAGLNVAAARAIVPITEAPSVHRIETTLPPGTAPPAAVDAESSWCPGDPWTGEGSATTVAQATDSAPASTALAQAVHADPSADRVAGSGWYATLRNHGPRVALEQLAGRQRALRRMGFPLDDLTVLAIQVDP